MNLYVGQTLWLQSHVSYQKSCETKIIKIGRQYAYLDNGDRIFIDTLERDGGKYSSNYTLWESKQEYDKCKEKDKLWDAIQRKIRDQYRVPKELSIEKIEQIYEILYGE